MSEDILVAYAGDVLEITLNRPERGNGMSDDMIRHLADVVEAEHEKARLIVLRANGDDFCPQFPKGRRGHIIGRAMRAIYHNL